MLPMLGRALSSRGPDNTAAAAVAEAAAEAALAGAGATGINHYCYFTHIPIDQRAT